MVEVQTRKRMNKIERQQWEGGEERKERNNTLERI